jgi:hypothetical protein
VPGQRVADWRHEARTEADLIRRDAASLRAELLVSCITAAQPSTPAFIAAVAPLGRRFTPRLSQPLRPPAAERRALPAAAVPTYRTDYEGALTFAFEDGATLAPHAQRDADRRYWHDVPVRAPLPPLD